MVESEILEFIKAGKKVRAVKAFRALHECSLKDAVDAVEAMQHDLEAEPMRQDPELAGRVDALLHEGRFLDAIRLHRSGGSCDLRQAKEAIDKRARELGIERKPSFWSFIAGRWGR